MEEYIAVIRMFAGNFAPQNFAFCHGQIMSIMQNTALFSLVGTTYGGNGQTTFGLPDLRGRVPVGTSGSTNVPGLPYVNLGDVGGTQNVTLLTTHLPAHNHGINVTEAKPTESTPVGNLLTVSPTVGSGPNATQMKSYAPVPAQGSGTTLKQMAAQATTLTGNNQAFPIMQPYLGINFIIALYGIFPARS